MPRDHEPEYRHIEDERFEVDDEGNIIVETGEPYCTTCNHYHTGTCLCPECGQREPCGVAGHS